MERVTDSPRLASNFFGYSCGSFRRAQQSKAGIVSERKTSRWLTWPSHLLAALLIIIWFFGPTYTQSTASLEGQVNDQHGATIAAVKLTLVNPEIGLVRLAVTDSAGRYPVQAL